MIKIQLIPLALVIILTVTVANLFYYPWLGRNKSKGLTQDNWLWMLVDPISTSQCPLRGFKCPSPQDCNCTDLCGRAFMAFQVQEGDNIVVMDKKIEPGTYCLPKGVDECNQKTSTSIYSMSGWLCMPKNDAIYRGGKRVACKNDLAANNKDNVLWDFEKDEAVTDDATIENFYEKNNNGLRYNCKCDSLDKFGNRMVNTLPFVCSVDYCMTGVPNRPGLGWNGRVCECGPFPHMDPLDDKSPCVLERTRLENDILYGKVECTTDDSFEMKAWYCPPGKKGFVSFETNMANVAPKKLVDFIKTCLRDP